MSRQFGFKGNSLKTILLLKVALTRFSKILIKITEHDGNSDYSFRKFASAQFMKSSKESNVHLVLRYGRFLSYSLKTNYGNWLTLISFFPLLCFLHSIPFSHGMHIALHSYTLPLYRPLREYPQLFIEKTSTKMRVNLQHRKSRTMCQQLIQYLAYCLD